MMLVWSAFAFFVIDTFSSLTGNLFLVFSVLVWLGRFRVPVLVGLGKGSLRTM